jgi:hypothetical protein
MPQRHAPARRVRAAFAGVGFALLGLGVAAPAFAFTDGTGLGLVNDVGGVDPSASGLSGLKVDEPGVRSRRKACPENFDGAESACDGMRALDALMPSDRKTSPRLTDPLLPDQRLP